MSSGYTPPNDFSTDSNRNGLIPVSKNQITTSPPQDEIQNLQSALKSSSKFVSCPYCKYQAMTQIDRSCSVPNIILSVASCLLPWLLIQACRGKDINCYNVEHFCKRCQNKLASYNSC